jgi:dTDP-4-dehydrorhamnose reductase
MRNKNYLIIGGDSFLGSEINEYLTSRKHRVITTTRRTSEVTESNLYLDLNNNLESWRPPDGIDHAILCSAITSLEKCHKNPALTRRINIDSILSISEKLLQNNIPVIYLSTSLVFSGDKPYQHENDPPDPVTEYGKQKAIVEGVLLDKKKDVSIVRVTKVPDIRAPLINNWIKQLKKGLYIKPFSDLPVAPVPATFVAHAISSISDYRSHGIWQLSGPRDITYFEMAEQIATAFGFDTSLITPVKASESMIHFEHIPQYSTLDTTKLKIELGLDTPDIDMVIDYLVQKSPGQLS